MTGLPRIPGVLGQMIDAELRYMRATSPHPDRPIHWHLDPRNTTPELLAWWTGYANRVLVIRVDRNAWAAGHLIVVHCSSWTKAVVG